MSADIELKLALSPKQLARLRSHAVLRDNVRGERRNTRLIKTYYDTPNRLLRHNAIALDVSRVGNRQVQTIATNGNVAATEVHGDGPEFDLVANPQWRKLLTKGGRRPKLLPVFTTDVQRNNISLQLDDSRIDVAFDVGRIRADGREQPICEARLALVAGQPERLYKLALELHDLVPFHLEHRDKVLRGYTLSSDERLQAVRAAQVSFPRDIAIGPAFHALAHAGFSQLCGNEQAVLRGDNPDAVHQMRVAARRLRALLSAFESELDRDAARFLRGELRWLQQRLGAARDWDVFLKATLEPLVAGLQDEASLDELRRAAEQARHDAYAVACDALRDRRYTRLLLKFQWWLDSVSWDGQGAAASLKQPMTSLAETVLDKRNRKLRKLASRFSELDETQMHEVRLRAKKLRYAAEFFGPLYPAKTAKKFVQSLVEIQDTLGTLHDAIAGRDLLKTLRPSHRSDELERAAGVAAGFQAARIADDVRRFNEVWPSFTKLKKFWRTH